MRILSKKNVSNTTIIFKENDKFSAVKNNGFEFCPWVPIAFFSCNSNARTLVPIKLGVVGGDAYINSVLRPYVEHFSNKSPDWQNYAKFLVIPFGKCEATKSLMMN